MAPYGFKVPKLSSAHPGSDIVGRGIHQDADAPAYAKLYDVMDDELRALIFNRGFGMRTMKLETSLSKRHGFPKR